MRPASQSLSKACWRPVRKHKADLSLTCKFSTSVYYNGWKWEPHKLRCLKPNIFCFSSCAKCKKVGLYLAASRSGSAATCGAALHCLPSAHSGQSGTSGRADVAELGSGHNLPAVSPHTCCRRKRIWTGRRWSRTRWCLWARCPLIPGHPSPGWSHINSLPAGRGKGQ